MGMHMAMTPLEPARTVPTRKIRAKTRARGDGQLQIQHNDNDDKDGAQFDQLYLEITLLRQSVVEDRKNRPRRIGAGFREKRENWKRKET